MKEKKLTSENLKNELWSTLQKVKAKKIQPIVANAVANQSREILRVVRTEMEIAKMANVPPPHALLDFSQDK